MASLESLDDTDLLTILSKENETLEYPLHSDSVQQPDPPTASGSLSGENWFRQIPPISQPLPSDYSPSGGSNFVAGERTLEVDKVINSLCNLHISPRSDNYDEDDSQSGNPVQKNSSANEKSDETVVDVDSTTPEDKNSIRGPPGSRAENGPLSISEKPQMKENINTPQPQYSRIGTQAIVYVPIRVEVDTSDTSIFEEKPTKTNVDGNAHSAEGLSNSGAANSQTAGSLLRNDIREPGPNENVKQFGVDVSHRVRLWGKHDANKSVTKKENKTNHCSFPGTTPNHPSSYGLQSNTKTLKVEDKFQGAGYKTSSSTQYKRSAPCPTRLNRDGWVHIAVVEGPSPAGLSSKAAKDAARIALSRYQSFMKNGIIHALLTDKCVEKLHDTYMRFVVNALSQIKNPGFQANYPSNVQVEIEKTLKGELILYKKMNRENLQKMAILRKKLLQEGENEYHRAISALEDPFKVPVKTLQHNHKEGVACALTMLHKNTHDFSPSLLHAWTTELISKLESSGRRYTEENNAKDNPPMATEIPRRACEKEQGVPSKTPCGVSIYLAKGEIHVGVYTNSGGRMYTLVSLFSPLIAFTNEGILISNEAKSHKCLNVHHLLENSAEAFTTISIDGKEVTLEVEYIVESYFHGLRVQLESQLRYSIKSCVIAISGIFTSHTKQLLQTSLRQAGFERSVLLPISTAMALSYVMRRKMEGNEEFSDQVMLVVCQVGDTLETVSMQVSLDNVKVVRGFHLPTTKETGKGRFSLWGGDNSHKQTKRVFQDFLANEVVKQAIVIFDDICSCNNNFAATVQKILTEFKIQEIRMDKHVDIISLCAALDASQNPAFEGKRTVFPGYANETLTGTEGSSLHVNKNARNDVVPKQASTFKISPERSTSTAAIRDNLMEDEEWSTHARAKLGPSLCGPAEKHTSNQMEQTGESSNSYINSSRVDGDPTTEIRKKLSQLVEDVKMKVRGDNGATNPVIIKRINDTVIKCQELLGKPEVNIKQLELTFKVLETHAAKIIVLK